MKVSMARVTVLKSRLGERAGVRGNPAKDCGITQNQIKEEANEVKLPWLPMIVLILVLVFVSSTAFGDVNQFEIETGLTVDALMFPDVITERTVESTGACIDFESHQMFAVENYMIYRSWEIMTEAQPLGPVYNTGTIKSQVIWDNAQYGLGFRIFGPLLDGGNPV